MLKTVTGGECSLIRLDGHPRPAFLSKEEVKSGETCGNKLKKPEVAILQTKGTVVRDGIGVWVGIGVAKKQEVTSGFLCQAWV